MKRRTLIFITFAAFALIALGAVVLLLISSNAPQTTGINIAQTCITLTEDDSCLVMPTVSGDNLDGETLTLPDDFAGTYNLVVMPFDREQQVRAADWVPLFQDLAQRHDAVAYYNVAALPDLAPAIRFMVTTGLNAAVQDPAIRQATVILYLEQQEAFVDALAVTDTETIQVFISNAAGEVLWRGAGDYNAALGDELSAALAALVQD